MRDCHRKSSKNYGIDRRHPTYLYISMSLSHSALTIYTIHFHHNNDCKGWVQARSMVDLDSNAPRHNFGSWMRDLPSTPNAPK